MPTIHMTTDFNEIITITINDNDMPRIDGFKYLELRAIFACLYRGEIALVWSCYPVNDYSLAKIGLGNSRLHPAQAYDRDKWRIHSRQANSCTPR